LRSKWRGVWNGARLRALNDPQSGLMPPRHFVPILEETGLIHEVVTEIERAISTAPDAASGLELELTESLIMENVHTIS
jgi:EAL domain-containing protein (putative c-di-GMP-specific phosphodiesterase class I)